ncbi:hypothetical protein CMU93_09005 [Elizabethkingia anophelis]|nr:hypothetical protein [Elizabethkingia anophelis]
MGTIPVNHFIQKVCRFFFDKFSFYCISIVQKCNRIQNHISWETSKKSVSKQWIVRYEYTDKSGVILPKALRGMNHIKDHGERVLYTKFLLKQEQKLLDKGYTPVTEEFEGVTETLILTPRTPFMRANAWITKSSAVSWTHNR